MTDAHPRFRPRGRNYARRRITNALMLTLTGVATLLAIVPLVWIIAYVALEGGRFLSLDFFTQLPTPVGVPGGGIANALVGSAIVVGMACLIAIPVSLVAAFYVSDHPNTPLGVAVRFGTDVLSGIPSIVMGIFAYTVIVLPQKHFSALAGAVALAVIMTPIVLRTTEEMLKLVPRDLREGSLALGAPEWKTALQVLLPAALNGVVTGVMLGIARVAGEAAPMIFTAFGNPFFSTDVNQPIATLPHTIFVYAISPYRDWHAKAWTTALVLIALVLGLNIAARGLIGWRTRRLAGK
ncbi:MAG: phosphate ABC transporter permease PstA [Chloroflexota bacterium]|nr:phosphate ABC transporter permease PstA [Chloroflexota bacterium]